VFEVKGNVEKRSIKYLLRMKEKRECGVDSVCLNELMM